MKTILYCLLVVCAVQVQTQEPPIYYAYNDHVAPYDRYYGQGYGGNNRYYGAVNSDQYHPVGLIRPANSGQYHPVGLIGAADSGQYQYPVDHYGFAPFHPGYGSYKHGYYGYYGYQPYQTYQPYQGYPSYQPYQPYQYSHDYEPYENGNYENNEA